ncbi:MAG: VWA domain-containing protein [Hyphomicrobium sp.]
MTKRELENLKSAGVPPLRGAAKRAGIDAALVAFDASAKDEHTNFETTSQGNVRSHRPMRTSNREWSFRMGYASRQNMAIAASLAALVIAAPIAFRTYENPQQDRRERESAAPLVPANPADGEDKKKAVGPYSSGHGDAKQALASTAALSNDRPSPPPPPAAPRESEPAPMTKADPSDAVARALPQRSMSFLAGDVLDRANRSVRTAIVADERAEDLSPASPYADRDVFEASKINPVKQVATDPVSTFSVDVDTASYAFVRRALNAGHLPPKDAVRVEEMINYFPYDYPAPATPDVPFKPTVTVMPAPWKPTDMLVHIAVKGYDLKRAERPRANLVFLLDVSGSMESEDRLPLIKTALRLLIDQLQADDTVGIVTYASGSGIALEPTKISDKQKILTAIDKLEAGGSTDGADGIADAYRLAEANFDKAAVNRIVLATDGDFNVGVTDRDQLKSMIERKRASGIYLSILGVGHGNHNDALMQALAQNGNGTAAYVDTLNEARKVLVDEASSTLFPIAKDVKAQVEWNPARVSEYRLIGYETRALAREDFNNDQVDAGDIGSGHTVTAIYEITPTGAPRLVDDLRYGTETSTSHERAAKAETSEFGFLKLRYKKPGSDASELISLPIADTLAKPTLNDVPQDVRFSVAVAAFGDLLRGAPYESKYSFDDVVSLAQGAKGDDPYGYRAEFLNLARLAKSARP